MCSGSQQSQLGKMLRRTKAEMREYNETNESTSFVLNVRDISVTATGGPLKITKLQIKSKQCCQLQTRQDLHSLVSYQ